MATASCGSREVMNIMWPVEYYVCESVEIYLLPATSLAWSSDYGFFLKASS